MWPHSSASRSRRRRVASSRLSVAGATWPPRREISAARWRSYWAIRCAVISVISNSSPKARRSFPRWSSSPATERFRFPRLNSRYSVATWSKVFGATTGDAGGAASSRRRASSAVCASSRLHSAEYFRSCFPPTEIRHGLPSPAASAEPSSSAALRPTRIHGVGKAFELRHLCSSRPIWLQEMIVAGALALMEGLSGTRTSGRYAWRRVAVAEGRARGRARVGDARSLPPT